MSRPFENVIREDFLRERSAASGEKSRSDYLDDKEDAEEAEGNRDAYYIALSLGGLLTEKTHHKGRQRHAGLTNLRDTYFNTIDCRVFNSALNLKCIDGLVSDPLPQVLQARKRGGAVASKGEDFWTDLVSVASASLPVRKFFEGWIQRSTIRSILEAQGQKDARAQVLNQELVQEVQARFIACIADRGFQAQQSGELEICLVSFGADNEVKELDNSFLLTCANDFGMSLFKSSPVIAQLTQDYWLNANGNALSGAWGELQRKQDCMQIIPATKVLLRGFSGWE